ncbi:hypothetical protein SNEBB_007733 [Seison nebaliae]|nr:hypothetical protein SNEBB_007733 [Seison nebaliae]
MSTETDESSTSDTSDEVTSLVQDEKSPKLSQRHVSIFNRMDWSDVKPMPINIDLDDMVQISYDDEFMEVYSYIRALMNKKEMSRRAYDLTTKAIGCNPADYTVWRYRRQLISSLEIPYSEEILFLTKVMEDNPKNYQVWHHRRTLVEMDDNKNYHAWQYRRFLLTHFKFYNEEMKFTDEFIQMDPMNNSAWNYRFYVIKEHPTNNFANGKFVEQELNYTFAKLKNKSMTNESIWNYLRGIGMMVDSVKVKLKKFYEDSLKEDAFANNTFALENYAEAILLDTSNFGANPGKECLNIYDRLIELDPVRKTYWEHLKMRTVSTMEKLKIRDKETIEYKKI